MCGIGRGPSQFGERSAKVTKWGLIPLDGSVNFCEKSVVRRREF